MPLFYVKAISDTGEKVTKTYEFSDELILHEYLDKLGMTVVSVSELPAILNISKVTNMFRKIKADDVIEILTNIHIIIASGMSATAGLEDLAKDAETQVIADILLDMSLQLQNGASLSAAMATHKNVFNDTTVGLVRIGEETGALEQTLADAIKNLKRISELSRKTKSALMYPVAAFVALTGAMIFWLVAVMPQIMETFTAFDMELPLTTRMIRALSNFLQEWILVILVVAFGLFMAFVAARKNSPRFVYATDKLLLKIPVIGDLVGSFNLAFFTEYVRLMIAAGLPLYQSLNIIEESIGNAVFKRSIGQIKDSIELGHTFAQSIIDTGNFTSLTARMVSVGEQSGRLEEQLTHISTFYYDRVDSLSENMAKVIEPVVLLFAGGMMAFFIMGLLGPIYDLLGTIG